MNFISLLLVCSTAAWVVTGAPSWGVCPSGSPANTECAYVSVPLSYTDTKSKATATIFVSRLHKQGVKPPATIWYFGDGCTFENDANGWVKDVTGLGFFVAIIDVRGSGRSYPLLNCTGDTNGGLVPNAACAEKMKNVGVENFGLTSIAHDVNTIISELGSKDNNLALADSFGSLIVQRVQTIYPDLINKAILSSYTAPDRYDIFKAIDNYDAVIRRVLRYCEDTPLCAARVGGGGDLSQTVNSIMLAAEQGTLPITEHLSVPKGIDRSHTKYFKKAIGQLLSHLAGPTMISQIPDRDATSFIPAVLYRLRRGLPEDAAVIDKLFGVAAANAKPRCPSSLPMRTNILLNEFVAEHPPTLESMLSNAAAAVVPPDTTYLTAMRQLYDVWPKYSVEAKDRAYTKTKAPSYLVAGDLDTTTSYDLALFSQLGYDGANFKFLKFQQMPHRLLFTASTPTSAVNCIVQMLTPLFTDKAMPACVGDLTPLDFMGTNKDTAAARKKFFGTEDSWNFTSIPDAPIPTMPPSAVPVPTSPTLSPSSPSPSSSGHHSTPSPPEDHSGSGGSGHIGVVVAVCVTIVVLAGLGVFLFVKYGRKKDYANRDFYGSLQMK